MLDEVITLSSIKDENGGSYRAFVTRADNPYGFPSKDRSGRLDALEAPDLGQLINKCLNVTAPANAQAFTAQTQQPIA